MAEPREGVRRGRVETEEGEATFVDAPADTFQQALERGPAPAEQEQTEQFDVPEPENPQHLGILSSQRFHNEGKNKVVSTQFKYMDKPDVGTANETRDDVLKRHFPAHREILLEADQDPRMKRNDVVRESQLFEFQMMYNQLPKPKQLDVETARLRQAPFDVDDPERVRELYDKISAQIDAYDQAEKQRVLQKYSSEVQQTFKQLQNRLSRTDRPSRATFGKGITRQRISLDEDRIMQAARRVVLRRHANELDVTERGVFQSIKNGLNAIGQSVERGYKEYNNLLALTGLVPEMQQDEALRPEDIQSINQTIQNVKMARRKFGVANFLQSKGMIEKVPENLQDTYEERIAKARAELDVLASADAEIWGETIKDLTRDFGLMGLGVVGGQAASPFVVQGLSRVPGVARVLGQGASLEGFLSGATISGGAWLLPELGREAEDLISGREFELYDALRRTGNGMLADLAFFGTGTVAFNATNIVQKASRLSDDFAVKLAESESVSRAAREAVQNATEGQRFEGVLNFVDDFLDDTLEETDIKKINQLKAEYMSAPAGKGVAISKRRAEIMDQFIDAVNNASFKSKEELLEIAKERFKQMFNPKAMNMSKDQIEGFRSQWLYDLFEKNELDQLTKAELAQVSYYSKLFDDAPDLRTNMADEFLARDADLQAITRAASEAGDVEVDAAIRNIQFTNQELRNFHKIHSISRSPEFLQQSRKFALESIEDNSINVRISQGKLGLGPAHQIAARIEDRTDVPIYKYLTETLNARRRAQRLANEGNDVIPAIDDVTDMFERWGMSGQSKEAMQRKEEVMRFLFDLEQGVIADEFDIPKGAFRELPTGKTEINPGKIPMRVFRQYGLDEEQIEAARRAPSLFRDLGDFFGLPASVPNYLRRNVEGPIPESMWKFMRERMGISTAKNPARIPRTQDFDQLEALDQDLEFIIKQYLRWGWRERAGYTEKFRRLRQMGRGIVRDLRIGEAQAIPEEKLFATSGVARTTGSVKNPDVDYLTSYIEEIGHMSDFWDVMNTRRNELLIKRLNAVDSELGNKARRYLKRNSMVDFISNLQYFQTMGYSLSTAMKNMSQKSLAIGLWGLDRFLQGDQFFRGNKALVEKVARELDIRNRFIEFGTQMGETRRLEYGDQMVVRLAKSLKDSIQNPKNLGQNSMAFFSTADFDNVGSSVSTALVNAENVLQNRSVGWAKNNFEKFAQEAGFDILDPVIKQTIKRRMKEGATFPITFQGNPITLKRAASLVKSEKASLDDFVVNRDSALGLLAESTTWFTQFNYGIGAGHRALFHHSSPIKGFNRAFGQFQSWRLFYGNYLTRLFRQPNKNANRIAHLLQGQRGMIMAASSLTNESTKDWDRWGPLRGSIVRSPAEDAAVSMAALLQWYATGPRTQDRQAEKYPYIYTTKGEADKAARVLSRILVSGETPVGRPNAVWEIVKDMYPHPSTDELIQIFETGLDLDIKGIGIENEQRLDRIKNALENDLKELADFIRQRRQKSGTMDFDPERDFELDFDNAGEFELKLDENGN